MTNIPRILADELSLREAQVQGALALHAEGATVPFIARYRKERTGEMNEIQLRQLFERFAYLTELEARKETILESIAAQGRLTDELRARIEESRQKAELEDLYLPFKPRRRTRATAARERGLEPLADRLRALNRPDAAAASLEAEAAPFVSAEQGVASAGDALQGAADILAEEVSEKAELRARVRDFLLRRGVFVSRMRDGFPEGSTKFEMYRDFRAKVSEIAPHNMLALRRGEAEEVLVLDLEFDEPAVLADLFASEVRARQEPVRRFFEEMVRDAFRRLMHGQIVGEVRLEQKRRADEASVRMFEANLRDLLLASPAGMKPTLGVDPGFRTGCKIVAVDETGKLLEHATVYPHTGAGPREQAARVLRGFIERHRIELVAIGNGTAGRETDAFVGEALAGLEPRPVQVMVSEAGASVYSASEAAIEEFPELDLTVRGAVSIARRLQDPLAELVKIDPKSIGVGQYQHDVDQELLRRKLDETVESCVNFVGVDLNTASKELLSFVSGLTPSVAKSIVAHRNRNGRFRSRQDLMAVPRFGPKAFEQAAGFLRIRGGASPLDDTAVHPERYPLVERMAADLGLPVQEIPRAADRLRRLDLRRYASAEVGEPTLRDILAELEKPGRDPRAEFRYATFREGVREIRDLHPGMELEGVVTNVTKFGAFVDVGVHQDGLVHISQLADRFVKDPTEVVRVGQVVQVRVLEVNEKLKRIGLTMRKADGQKPAPRPKAEKPPPDRSRYTIEDLKARFGKS